MDIVSKLKDLKCINISEYKNSKTKNLRLTCKQCNGIFVTSWGLLRTREYKDICPTCTKSIKGNKVPSNIVKGCKNINDYIDAKTKNLVWECTICGKDIVTSHDLMKSKKQVVCNSCSNIITHNNQKVSSDELNTLGCLNTAEYKNIDYNNLKFLCDKCNNIITTSLRSRRVSKHKLCKSCSQKRGRYIKKGTYYTKSCIIWLFKFIRLYLNYNA